MDKLVSIALCTYNGEKYLEEQFLSLLIQSYANFEIVVVDDNSTDSTWQILNKFKDNPKVRLYRNETNLGFIKNFEKAVSLCKGDFIAFSDQDDIWSENKIEVLVDLIGDHLLVYSDSEHVDEYGVSMGRVSTQLRNFYAGNDYRSFLFYNCVSGHAMMIKKELLHYVLPFPSNMYHDWWIAYNATLFGDIAYTNLPLVKYRQHSSSDHSVKTKLFKKKKLTNKDRLEKVISWLVNFKQHNAKFNKDVAFIDELVSLYMGKKKFWIAPKLFVTLLQNKEILFYIYKRSNLKRVRMMCSDCFSFSKLNTFYIPLDR
jgi:glycosyltransferase involved in cell wall biosynthesis